MPTTLTARRRPGRSIDLRTSICAARWKITSGATSPTSAFSAARVADVDLVQPRAATQRAGLEVAPAPGDEVSTTSTSSPWSSSASTRFDPMKPAPPVTSARMRAREATSAAPGRWLAASSARGATASYSAARRGATTSGAARAGAPPPARGTGARVVGDARGRRRPARRRRPAATSATSPSSSASAPTAGRDDRQARGHRLERGEAERLVRARGDERDGGRGAQARQRGGVDAAGERDVGARAQRLSAQLAASGPSPQTVSGRPARAHAAIATSTPFSRARRETTSARGGVARAVGASSTKLAHDVAEHVRRPRPPAARRAPPAARAPRRSGRPPRRPRPPAAADARERGGVGHRLHARAAAVQAHARQRVAPVAARAVLAGRVDARADRADEAVVVQVQDRPRAGRPRRRQRAPAERRVEVVRVDDPRARAPHRRGDVVGCQPAAQQPAAARRAAERRAVALQHLGVLAQVLAHEPREVLDHALLAAGRAVAVVQEEDHERATLPLPRRGSPSPRVAAAPDRLSSPHVPPLTSDGPVPAPAAVILPTAGRPAYLDVALASIAPQARALGAEVLVVDDGPSAATRAVAERHGARYVAHDRSRGLNAARNTGARETDGAAAGLRRRRRRGPRRLARALLVADASQPADVGVLTGPILARFEDHPLHLCGREDPPITHLDLGPPDRDCDHAWGANMAVRRAALERVGPFDESARALRRRAGVAGAAEGRRRAHPLRRRRRARPPPRRRRRAPARAGPRRLPPRPRVSAASTSSRATAPTPREELRVLAGCALHGPRFRCTNGPILTAHSLGRLRSLLDERLALPPAPPAVAGVDDFLSGRSGYVAGKRGRLLRVHDALLDLAALPASAAACAPQAPRRPAGACSSSASSARDVPNLMDQRPRRAAALPPRRDDRRRARRRRPGQVREPQRAAGPPRPGDLRLGARHRRRRRAPARLPRHLPGRAPRPAACASPSPPTAATPTPPGT